jgi:hypothetical protein
VSQTPHTRFTTYIRDVLTIEPRPAADPLPVPTGPGELPYDRLRDVLHDPRVLFRDPPHATAPRDQMRRLIGFALWLGSAGDGLIAADLASRAARFRFLVWSLPARRPEFSVENLGLRRVTWPSRVADFTAIDDKFVREQARAARQDWLAHLAVAEDDPWLAARQQSGDATFEQDLRWLTAAWPGEPGHLNLASRTASAADERDDQRRVAVDIAEDHWLPRGAVFRAATEIMSGNRWKGGLALLAFPAASAVLLALLLIGHADWARCGSLLVVVAAMAAILVVPRRLDALALLRIPAAVAAGEAVLVSLTSRWWLAPGGWKIGVGLLAAAAWYVVLEIRLHGAPLIRAVCRGGMVTLVGASYAFVLSVFVLGFVTPSTGEHGECLAGWWNANPRIERSLDRQCAEALGQPVAAAPAGVLLLMTGWSFALGLAAQILWDDRPVTAPLGRIRRAKGAKP